MKRHGIPTADYETFSDPAAAHAYLDKKGAPIVIKADGLAAGKGVVVAMDLETAHAAVDDMLEGHKFGAAGARVVIEDYLDGEEASFIVMVDGEHILPLATSQDHKRLLDNDQGPNTGGMGAYSPAPVVTPEIHAQVMREIIEPTVKGMAADGLPYTGFLYAGLMIGKDGKTVVSEISAADFVKDGMISDVSYDTETHKITITWNTDAGKDAIELDLADLVNTYTAGTGLKLDTAKGQFSIDDTVVATKTWANGAFDAAGAAAGVKTAVDAYTVNGKKISTNPNIYAGDVKISDKDSTTVASKITSIESSVADVVSKAGVTSVGGQSGAITVKGSQTANGAINLAVSTGKELSATIVGLKSAAFTESSAYDAKGSAAAVDSKLTEATASLSKTISDNKTDAETKITGVRTDLTNELSTAKAELLGEGSGDANPTIKRAEAKADAAKAAADAAQTTADAAKTAAEGVAAGLGSNSISASTGTFITGVTVSQGKLTAATSGSVSAGQVSYTKPTAAPTGNTVEKAIYDIQTELDAMGVGAGSIASQIDAKINALDSSAANTATAAGSTASTQIEVTVEQVDGKLSSVAVAAPKFALPSDVTSAVSTAKTELLGAGASDTSATIKRAEAKAEAAQTAADAAKTAAANAASTAAETYVKKAGDTMTGGLKMVKGAGTTGCTIQWNATDAALEFVFE